MSHTIVGVPPRNPMWIYEENYRLLLHLLPEQTKEGDTFALASDSTQGELNVHVLEVTRYTATLLLAKPFCVDHDWLSDLLMKVRVYDDAGVMEVMGYQGCDRIPARYQVADAGRFHRDEKRQVNYLLHDLLRHCLRHGYRLSSPGITNA
ncbi:DUF1249 domain-containing protein [Thiohalomonas denitrificans]|uniref:DUF1249 domain-containing protein n=1 Tax=Thiohalomonas denitrificans TaxID=415747 RepID=UPI0026EAEAD7|nr:DUF1249 domain-containing protein [Thiohalomonas denitrificans]